MDIERFEEMIIDYLDGNLQGADKVSFEEKLNSSEECREIFNHYRSIREVSGSEEGLKPPAEVLESISQHVKQTVKQEKKPFFERFFKLPVLAPTLAVAIIAMLWVSAGEDYLKNRNIIPESEMSASSEFRSDYKAAAGKLNQQEAAIEEEELNDKETDLALSKSEALSDTQVAAKIPAAPSTEKKKQAFEAKTAEEDSSGISASPRLRQEAGIKDLDKSIKSDDLISDNKATFADSGQAQLDNIQEERAAENLPAPVTGEPVLKGEAAKSSQTIGSSLSRSTKTTDAGSPSERVAITNNYRNELNEIVTLQYKGDCSQSLTRAQKLLDADPEPSVSIKTDLYVTQGECFMELKQYDKALEVYEKAKELTPHKSYLFNGKIKEAYIQQGK